VSYLGAGADWRKRNYLIEPEAGCANTGAVNRVTEAQFAPLAGSITFNEVALLTPNALITRAMYGGVIDVSPDVQCGPSFLVQLYQNIFDPDGFPFLKGAVSAPLTVNVSGFMGPDAAVGRTVNDPAWAGYPPGDLRTLAGNIDFTIGYPFAIGFSIDVVGVGFTLGGFNMTESCRVRAYDRAGNLLGTWTNTALLSPGVPEPFESFYLNRDSNVPIIAGVSVESSDELGIVMKNVVFSNTCA
jgi:hypothetical protein